MAHLRILFISSWNHSQDTNLSSHEKVKLQQRDDLSKKKIEETFKNGEKS